ncbi:MAG: DUF917 family protein [Ignisphaera sp.]
MYGGAFFGGGGGGDIATGLKIARIAIEFGDVVVVDIESVSEDRYIVTSSIVGAPAAKEKYLLPTHMVRSAELFIDTFGESVGGFISSENGGASTANGWIPSAVLGIPIVDAPADGRAHPTGVMGSMGLHRLKDYVSLQVAVGGSKLAGRYVEVIARGSLDKVDRIIREAAVQAGGMVAVTRNPLKPGYVKENAAVGALSKAIEVGRIIRRHWGDAEAICSAVIGYLGGGSIVDRGVVEKVSLETRGGYDIGSVVVRGGGGIYEITFWNEYMTLEDSMGRRLAAFPDLIATIDAESGVPITSAEIRTDNSVFIVAIPKEYIPLGSGVKDPEILAQVENVVGRKLG